MAAGCPSAVILPPCVGRLARLTGAGALVGGILAVGASIPAGAATTHDFTGKITQAPPGSALMEPGPATVDRATGDVFMADAGAGVIDVFNASGSFVTQFGEQLEPTGVAVDESSGLVYVSSESTVVVFEPAGEGSYVQASEWSGANTPGEEFSEVTGVTFDNSKGPNAGDLYVLDGGNNVVDLFKPKPAGPEEAQEGSFVSVLKGAKLEEPNAIAIDASSGQVYVADSPDGFVARYSPAGVFEEKLRGSGSPEGSFSGREGEEGNVRAIAAEEGTLYVAEAERQVVSQFNGTSGEWQGWITRAEGPLLEPAGVAAAPGGLLYVADAASAQLDLYGVPVTVPDARTEKATELGKTAAVLTGVVNGDGKPAQYRFEYGPTEAYGSLTPVQSAGAGEEKVQTEVSGLSPGTSYHFRLITENENGANTGADKEFETLPSVEGLSTGPAQDIQPTEATLTGTLTPNGVDAHYLFEWGSSTGYGSSTQSTDAGPGKGAVQAKATLTGLTPNTSYHYRITAENQYGGTIGEDKQLTTSGPPRITSEPASALTHESATLNAKLDPDELETTYHFEYGESSSYGAQTPVAKLAAGETPIPVTAALTGLKIGAIYHYRLVAENSAGETFEPDQTFQAVPPALIEDTSAIGVSSSEATLQAQINPLGHDTIYYFQYGTQPCNPNPALCTSIPLAPGQDIGGGETPVPVSQPIAELTPQTTYYYRAVTTNSLGTSRGPEHAITTQAEETPFTLPDHRAWEMVTPPDKGGAPVEALTREGGLIRASENGEALTYLVGSALGQEVEGNRTPEWQQILATRSSTGWSSTDIATPSIRAKGVYPGAAPEYQFFTPDLASALVEPVTLAGGKAEPPLAPGVTQATIYVRNDGNGTYLPLVTEANTAPGTEFGGKLHFVAATPDLDHAVISSTGPLTGAGSAAGLYEWAAGGALQFVSVLPDGAAASPVELGFYHVAAHAISNDGSRIIWTKKEESTAAGHLYMRDTVTDQTIQLDAAQGVAEPPKGSAQFQWASGDGSKVFFTDKQRLTPDSTAEPNKEPPSADLYECEVAEENGKLACDLKDLTVDGSEGGHAAVQYFILGASEDGTSIYFIAHGVLAPNQNGNGETAQSAEDNVYELHEEGDTWNTTFIATLSSEDSQEWEGFHVGNSAYLTARVSPNGGYLAFMSSAPITGYDNGDASPEAKGTRDEEVFLYDSATASLRCVSCNPSGALPEGVLDREEAGEGLGLLVDRREVWLGHRLAGNIPGWMPQNLVSALFQSRYLTDEGRLYFNSPDDLVPAATNHKEDVYEYEPSGAGSCQSPSGGCVSLVSGGSSDRESAFLEATPNGSNVFFLTEAQLLPQDTDTAFDIYDARECTALSPCLTPATAEQAPCAETETCRPAEPAQPIPGGVPATMTISGPGNVVAQAPPAKQGVAAKKTSSRRPLTRAQKLTRALKSCRKRYAHAKRKRTACVRKARKRYGRKRTVKRNSKTKSRSGRLSSGEKQR